MNGRKRFGKIRGDEGPCALLPGGVALREQLLESRDDRGPGHTELNGEFARRRQLHPGMKCARQDCRPQLQIDLAEHRRVGRAVDVERVKLCPALSALHERLSKTSVARSGEWYASQVPSGPFRRTTFFLSCF